MNAMPLPITTALSIEISDQIDRDEWDGFVRTQPGGNFFQLSGWGRALRTAYGYDPVYITARRGGAIAGVLPLIDVRAPLLGRSLISTAFTVGGGPLATDRETIVALLDGAAQEGETRGVRYIECRSALDHDGWLASPSTHANFSAPLIADEEAALKAIPRKRRAEIRKGLDAAARGELSIRHDGDPALFYRLYARSLRRLGTPVFPKTFQTALLATFAEESEISIVEADGKSLVALVTFYFGETVLPYYAGAVDDARAAPAFDFLYWSVMRRAAASGARTFDFGRSKIDSGAYRYKKLWGFTPTPLTHRIKLIAAKQAPNVNAANPKFALFAKLWPHLPLGVTNRLGPFLAPNFP